MKKKQLTAFVCLLLCMIMVVTPAISTQAATKKTSVYYAETDADEIIAVQRALFNREAKFTIRYLAKKENSFSYYAKNPEWYTDKFYTGDKVYDKYAWKNDTYTLLEIDWHKVGDNGVEYKERYVTAKGQKWLNIEYQYTYGETHGYTHFDKYSERVELLDGIRKLIADSGIAGKTDYEKVRWIYEWICENIKYQNSPRAGDTYWIFTTGQAVCGGYSLLFDIFAEELGLNSTYHSGTSDGGIPTLSNSHAWNMVELDGKWYLMDTTWGASSYTKDPYKYFLKGNDSFGERHFPLTKYPENVSATDFSNPNSTQRSYVLANVYGIQFDKVLTERLNIGEEYQWLLENKTDIELTFTNSNPNVVSISDDGKVKALKTGKTTLTVTNEEAGIKQSIEITVSKEAASLNEADKYYTTVKSAKNLTVTVGKTAKITPVLKDKYGVLKSVKYTVKDKKIATVDKNGKVKGVKAGKTTVTITCANGSKVTLNVTVKK